MVYLHALAADLKEQLEVTSRQVGSRETATPALLVRR